ncbi:hypothetical protein ACFWMR_20835 [Amycolatopsis thailandensis]|uniref:WXG100-like domain-containing protein n=1 Tax=Amycolatopsis thailandensis TaxID=589330 RepID=UPI0036558840
MPIKDVRNEFSEVPAWARTLLEVLGVDWPAANHNKFSRAAQEYDTVTNQLRQIPDEIARVKRGIDQTLSMPQAGESFDKSMAPLTHGTPNALEELADGTGKVAENCREIALKIQYAKYSAIGQLFMLAYEIAMEYALAAFTGGASLANLTWHYALTRSYLLTLFKMLVRAIAFELFIGITGGLLIDYAVQRLQTERKEWDTEATDQTLISGAIGGVLGGAVGELGERLGRKVGNLLGKDFGKIATDDLVKRFKDFKLPGGDALADTFVRDMGRTLTDRAGRQLADPATAFTKNAVDTFSDQVADRFGTAFGKTLGDDTARQLGRDYARTFVDNWSKHGLDGSRAFNDSLRDVLDPYSDKLGKDATDLLTDHVPDVLSRNVTDKLGGNLAARAAEFSTTFLFEGVSGVMSQAAMASINGEEVSPEEYGMGFVGGVVGGAVSHKLEGIGEKALDSMVTSIKEKFGDLGSFGKPPTDLSLDTGRGSDVTDTGPVTVPNTTSPPPNTTSTGPAAAPAPDVKSTSDTRAASDTKPGTDTKTVSDTKPAPKSTSDTKAPSEVKTSSPGKTDVKAPKQETAPTAVRTTSDEQPEEEERPRTRPAPLRTTSEDQPVASTSAAAQVQAEQTVTEIGEEPAPAIELDLGKPFAEDLFDGPEPGALSEHVPATTETTETTAKTTETPKDEQGLTREDLPPFLAAGQALGSAPVLTVDGTGELRDELARLLPGAGPRQLDAIKNAVHDDFESALDGLHFPIRTDKGWREVRIRATLGGDVVSEPREKTKADLTVQGGIANAENLAVLRAGDVGTAATVQAPTGPYLTVGGKVALAAPGATQTVSVSTSDQRAIRSGEGSRRVGLNVEFTVSVHDENGAEVGPPAGEERAKPVPGKVTVRLPDDLVRVTPPAGLTAKELTADVGRKLRNPVPEAVTDLAEVFTGTAGLLHRSVTAFGAPGRDALRAFLGTAGIRENFGAMLEGWVSSPALLSADGGKVAAVRMKAVLTKAEFVGPTTATQLRLHESATTGSTVSAFTKRGFDASVSFGGGGGVNGVKIAAGLGGGYSARTVDTVVAGRTSTAKAGIQLKGDIGLYRFEAGIVVQALDGKETTTTATVYARVGLAEAAEQGLPVPDGTGDGITPPSTEKFPPAHLAAGLAAGNVRVGEFTGADAVLTEIRDRLRKAGEYKDLLPDWDEKGTGAKPPGSARALETLANEHRLQAMLSPSALRNRMDALLGAGVSVTLKRQGVLRQDNITITVRLEAKPPKHIGRATGRVIRNATTTGPALGSSSATSKGWTAGPEGKVTFGATGTASAKYGSSSGTRTGAGPVTESTDLDIGSADSEGFEHEGRFVVTITGFSRLNATVRQMLPGLPGTQVPDVRRIWSTETADGADSLPANFTVWMSDSLTLPAKADQVAPGAPEIRELDPPRSITGHFQELGPPAVGDWIGVESIAHTGHVGKAALAALVEASDGDRALALPGSDAWTSVQAMLSTDNIKAALRSFTRGVVSTDLVHSRRLADRVGRIGVHAKLSEPTLVRMSDDAGSERSTSGGFRFDGGTSKSTGPAITAGVTVTGSATGDPTGTATGGLSGKPWAKTTTKADGLDISAVVDRNVTTAAGTPRVLARFDVDFTVLAEARQQTALIRPDARVAARTVHLPGAVQVWLTEDQAREHGLLPAKPAGPREREERLTAPATLPKGKPGTLGLGAVERLPDLSGLVPKLSAKLADAKIPLLPGVSLNDAMHNWARLTGLVSPDGVRGLVDSALDGGIPLHAHLPKLFTDSGYQVLLTAKTLGDPAFREVVNDGRAVEHSTVRAVRTVHTDSTSTAWSASVRAGGQKKYQDDGDATATSVGGAVTKGIGAVKVTGTTEVRTEQETRLRTGTGPAALFDVPIEFTVEVRRDGKTVAAAGTGKQSLGVRLLADNLTVGTDRKPDTGEDTEPDPLSAADATPAALEDWRRGTVTTLPDMASVESVRAAARLREVVRDTLTKAGADNGITGYGTAPVNALWSSLSPQVLQAFLPAMTTKSLPVPALREAAVLRGKRANVEVHARLGKPRTIALSDGVNLENPKNSTTARSTERKVAEVGELGVTGPTVTPVNEKDNVGGLVTGADTRWTSEPADATVDGTTVSAVANLKPVGRTALVRFDVDYRIVVEVDGHTEVVDVSMPGSADVRMPIEGLTDVTGEKTPRILKARQGRVARTAKAWRDAEVGAEGQRRRAEDLMKKLGAAVDWNATVDAARVRRPGTLEDRHHRYARETEKALREAENLAEAARLHHDRVAAATDEVLAGLTARTTDLDDLARGTADADRAFRVLSSELAAARGRVDLAETNQDLAAALDDVRRLAAARSEAKERRDLFREVLAEERETLAAAEASAAEAREQRVAAAEQLVRTQAGLQAAWLDFVDTKQDAWWLAKGALDAEFARITARPATPEDEKWRHSRETDAPWFSVANPLDPAQWEPLRAMTPSRSVATETADVLTTFRTGKDKRYDGVIRYGVSRFKVGDRGVTEFTVPINLVPGRGTTDEQLAQLRERATAGVERLINKRHGLPNGDQLHVRIEFTSDRLADREGNPRYRAYDVVAGDDERTTQTNWRSDATPEELAHELLHYLGAADEEHDKDRVFLSREDDGTTGVVTGDESIMGKDVVKPGVTPKLMPRHTWMIQHVLHSQLGPGHRLTDPGQDALPGVRPAADAGLTDAQRAALGRERRKVVQVGGDTVGANLVEAIARTLAPDSPARQAELRNRAAALRQATPEEVAVALDVRLELLTEDGGTVRLGPDDGEPVRVALTSSADFLATARVPVPPGLTGAQQDTLFRLGKTAVPAGGEPVTGNLIAAIAAAVAPESASRQAELRELGATLRNTTAAKIAEAFGVRLHVVTENGDDLAYGPAGPRPVRIVRTSGGEYLATRDVDTRTASRPAPNRSETGESDGYDSGIEREYGLDRASQRHFQHLADTTGTVFDVRPVNPDALRHALDGAQPAPAGLTAHTVTVWDVYLGMPEHCIGLVARFEPVPPDLDALPPAIRPRVSERYYRRRAEYLDPADTLPPRHRVLDGVVQRETPDGWVSLIGTDASHVRHPDATGSMLTDDVGQDLPLLGSVALTTPLGRDGVPDGFDVDNATETLIRFAPREPARPVLYDDAEQADDGFWAGLDDLGNSVEDDQRSEVSASSLDSVLAEATLDYEVESDGSEAPFTRFDYYGTVVDSDEFPFSVPVIRREAVDHPLISFSSDKTLALPVVEGGHFREFYATESRVASVNARLSELGSKVSLVVNPGNKVLAGGRTLVMVKPFFKEPPSAVCSEFAGAIMGAPPRQAVLRSGDGPPVLAPVRDGGAFRFHGTYEVADALAKFAAGTDEDAAIDPAKVALAMRSAGVNSPLSGKEYGTSLRAGTGARAKLDRAAAALGVNQYAWAEPGEAYVAQSVAVPGADGPDYGLNYSRADAEQLEQFFGYHFGAIVLNSENDGAQVSVEISRQSKMRAELLDDAIRKNIDRLGDGLKAEIDRHPPGTLERRFVEALSTMREIEARPDIEDVDEDWGWRNARAEARQALSGLAGDRLPSLGRSWLLRLYQQKKGRTFFEQSAQVEDFGYVQTLANPLVMVTTSVVSSASYQAPMGKTWNPVELATQGRQRLEPTAIGRLTTLAKEVTKTALWRHRNKLPMPEVLLEGYGNSRLHGTRTGLRRAQLAETFFRSKLDELIREKQKDLPPGEERLSADRVPVNVVSHGGAKPPGAPDARAARREVRATMTTANGPRPVDDPPDGFWVSGTPSPREARALDLLASLGYGPFDTPSDLSRLASATRADSAAEEAAGDQETGSVWHAAALLAESGGEFTVARLASMRVLADVARAELRLSEQATITLDHLELAAERLGRPGDLTEVLAHIESAERPVTAETLRKPAEQAAVTKAVFDVLVPTSHRIEAVPLEGNRGIRLDDASLEGVVGGYPADDRFFTFLAHGDTNGAPVRGAGSTPLSPSDVATLLARAKDDGLWDGEKPVMFASCGAGSGGGKSFAARVLAELRARGIDAEAVAPDGPVYFVPGAGGTNGPGHLVVTGKVGIDAAGLPVVAPNGNWVHLTGSRGETLPIGAHIVVEDRETWRTGPVPGYVVGKPVEELDGAVRLAEDSGRATDEISFREGSKDLDQAALAKVGQVARQVVATAVARREQGLPSPVVEVTGFGNGALFGIGQAVRTGNARAEATVNALRAAVASELERQGTDAEVLSPAAIRVVSASSPDGTTSRQARRRAVITIVTDPVAHGPRPVGVDVRPAPVERNPSDTSGTSAKSAVTVNSVAVTDPYPGKVLDRDVVTEAQQELLTKHGFEPVLVEGVTPHDSFREAVLASLPDRAPREHARITGKIAGFAKEHPDGFELDALARAADVQVHVLGPDGSWTSHGDETGRPVHILRADVDGTDAYLGTKENVHIGRPKVSYPGPTVLRSGKDLKVVHRGEFEVETVKGEHYVRIYTAVLSPAEQGKEHKDVHQASDGTVLPFSGVGREGPKVFWAGGGRPLRAVQWLSKYETDVHLKPGIPPVLRSFLVPLPTFLETSTQATVETEAEGNRLSMNVDQNGDTNQFGVRGIDYEALQKKALKGSLVTYTKAGHEDTMPGIAGRQEAIGDLYSRLGLRPDFDSARLGRENDPWFTWSSEGRKNFRNNPVALRNMARKLGNHYHTWKGSPDIYFTPATDSIPGESDAVVTDSPQRRVEDMHEFVNTFGPGKGPVEQLAGGIGAAIDLATRTYGAEGIPVSQKEFKAAVLGPVKNLLNPPQVILTAVIKEVDPGNNLRYDTIENLRAALKEHPEIAEKTAEVVAGAVRAGLVDQLGADVVDEGLGERILPVVHDVVRERVDALHREWGDELEALGKAKRGYLSGARGDAFVRGITKGLEADPGLKKLFAESGVRIAPETYAAQIKSTVVPKALRVVTKDKLIDKDEDALREIFVGRQEAVADALKAELARKNVGKLVAPAFRDSFAADVVAAARRPELLVGATFTKVTETQVDEFMDLVPEYATQAEIGSTVAIDERRIKVDFNTRLSVLVENHIEGAPFSNEFGLWRENAEFGYTQNHDAAVLAKHQAAGKALAQTIKTQLAAPNARSGKVIVDELVSRVDEGVTDPHELLARKFAETVKKQDGRADRAPGDSTRNTFGEHAQMVLNQYLKITEGHEDAARFVSREAIAKAILFHDMEKVNSKRQFGDAQLSHDREPEHRGAIQQMRRHEGLWTSRRDFELACRIVDSDPFGYYFREKDLDAKRVYDFIRGVAFQAKRPDDTAPSASDVRNLFREFHQYYQADFSSYSNQAKFVDDQTGDVRDGFDTLIGMAEDEDGGHVPVPGDHRLAYSNRSDGRKPSYEQKFNELAKLFDDAVAQATP